MGFSKLARQFLIFLVIASLGYLIYGIYSKKKQKRSVTQRIASLPNFVFETTNGLKVTGKDANGRPLWLIFFDTGCEYCQMEIEQIKKAKLSNDIQIWLVSTEPADTLAAFVVRHNLVGLQQVKVLRDTYHADYHIFSVTSSPASFLYDSHGSLIRQYKGIVKVQTVLKEARD
jgi:thioredoxin-related protein